ncbi:glycoside hydrolase family 27 protein [Gordonia soli]|uniref:Alpha-galactosidase n=1 Tax=Gordonia soli NBRC 108243 TaxID=1223545 RepID=M0QGL8_9ACTN|nr:glycoside hydrolase family 27 protein [Gordonia soli]GAC66552.1 putative alpha-galactosidase [Gordonia soli NBRC 108243]
MAVPGARWSILSLVLVVGLLVGGCAARDDDRLGGDPPAVGGVPNTPPMGWNSWNTFGCNVTEKIVRAQADALVSSGMRDSGYDYVVVDDCWSATDRASDGTLQADRERFPSGMAALGAYLHERGLKFGLYSGASDRTCTQLLGQRPGATGSRGHEKTDADTFAAWQVDFLKYDWCSVDADHDRQVDAFVTMRNALRDTGRPIVYSINPNSGVAVGGDDTVPGAAHDWGGVATMTRFTNDIASAWSNGGGSSGSQGVLDVIDAAGPLTSRVQAGAFLDPDMLEVGVAGPLTDAQQRTQMSMWAMMAAPLMAGNDLTTMTPTVRAILRNPAVIAIDQDQRVTAGAPIGDNREIWTRAIGDKGLVVSMTNRGDRRRLMTVTLSSLGLSGDATVSAVDAWTGKRYDAAKGALSVSVRAGDTALLQIA